MRIIDLPFHQYYHAFLIIEADDLTERFRDVIDVHEDDCYVLASSYCDEAGAVLFNVLAIGNDWDQCKRGLRRKAMLGILDMDDVYDRECQIVKEPSAAMITKNARFLKDQENNVDPDVLCLRKDERLDPLRAPGFADIVEADFLNNDELIPVDICCTGTEGPFLSGVLLDEVSHHKAYEPLKCLPYMLNQDFRLLIVQVGSHPSAAEKARMEKIRQYYEKAGVSFGGLNIRS